MRQPRSSFFMGQYSGTSAPTRKPNVIVSFFRGLMDGLVPLAILVGLLALSWELATIGRLFTRSQSFVIAQKVDLVLVIAGIAFSFLFYMLSAMRTLQGIRDRQREFNYVESTVALILLTISALVALAPLYLAFTFALHPAP